MSIKVYIPTPWRNLTGGKGQVEVEASNIAEILERLEALNPGFRSLVVNEKGEIFRHINIFVNQEVISPRLLTTIRDGDELAFVPALAGGRTGTLVAERKPDRSKRGKDKSEYPESWRFHHVEFLPLEADLSDLCGERI